MTLAFFYAFAGMAVAGGLLTVFLRNPVHCAIGLLLSLLGAGGIFLQTQAEFLLAAQLIVYAGGVVLLFLFVIMLVNLDRIEGQRRFAKGWLAGAGFAGLAGIELVALFHSAAFPPLQGEMPPLNTETIGAMLLTEYLLPFEAVSLLLLAALVGAVVLARSEA